MHVHKPIVVILLFKLFSNLDFEDCTVQLYKEPPFSFLQIECFTVWLYHSPILLDGHLTCFQLFAVTSSAAVITT